MNDAEIVGLYWQRDENAIACTDKKYRHYLYTIAYNILLTAKILKRASTTPILPPGIPFRPISPRYYPPI